MKIDQHHFPTNMLDAKGKTKVTTNFYVFGNATKALQDALFGCNK